MYFITLHFLVRKIFTFYINDVLLFKCPFPGPKGQYSCSMLTQWKRVSLEQLTVPLQVTWSSTSTKPHHNQCVGRFTAASKLIQRVFSKYISFRIHVMLSSSCFCVCHWVPNILCASLVSYVRVRYAFHVIFPYSLI